MSVRHLLCPKAARNCTTRFLTGARGRGAKVRVRGCFVTQSSQMGTTTMYARKTRAGTRWSPPAPARRSSRRGGAMQSVVHEMTLVQDLCAAAHQRGQVLICMVAAEVQLATRRHRRTNPGASAAGVATIRRIQLRLVQYGAFKSLCVHASITHHHPAPCTPVHPGRNRPPARRHNETGEWKSLQRQPQHAPKRYPPARSGPGLVNRGKRPRTGATRTVGHKRAPSHI